MATKKKTEETTEAAASETPAAPKIDSDRKARWAAFLEKASKENATFGAQKAAGEFDNIPDSFI